MKKLLVALPFVASASWAGTTLYAGNQSHTTYDVLISQLNEWKPFAVENESYTSGFLQSIAVTNVKESGAPDARVLFRLRHVIDHSTVAFDNSGARIGSSIITTTLLTDDMPTQIKEDVLSGFTDSTPFVLTTSMGIGGKSNELVLNTYSKTMTNDRGEQIQINYDGGSYQISHQNQQVMLNGALGAFKMAIQDEAGIPSLDVSIAQSTTTANMQLVSAGIYTGDFSHEFPTVDVQIPELGGAFNVRNVSMTSSTNLNDGALSSGASFTVGNLEAPMPLPVSSAGLSFDVSGIPLEGLKAYMNIMNDVSLLEQLVLEDPEAARKYLEASKSMLAPGASISYQVNAGNEGGDMMGAVSLEFVGDGSGTGFDSLNTAGDALRTIKATATFNGDAAAVDMTPLGMMIAMRPEAEQFIIADDTSYKTELSVENLNADINGTPFPLEMMLGEMLDMPLDMLMAM